MSPEASPTTSITCFDCLAISNVRERSSQLSADHGSDLQGPQPFGAAHQRERPRAHTIKKGIDLVRQCVPLFDFEVFGLDILPASACGRLMKNLCSALIIIDGK